MINCLFSVVELLRAKYFSRHQNREGELDILNNSSRQGKVNTAGDDRLQMTTWPSIQGTLAVACCPGVIMV